MTHRRGNRSGSGKIKQRIRGYIYTNSFWDQRLKEKICLTSRNEIIDFTETLQSSFNMNVIPDVMKGLVLSNPYGHGTSIYPLEPL